MASKFYAHLMSGSTFIMPSGKVITFAGKKGGPGLYETSDEKEQEQLDALVKNPQTMLSETTDPAHVQAKALDPAVLAAAAEVQKIAEHNASPELIAAQANLGKAIAAAAATDTPAAQ